MNSRMAHDRVGADEKTVFILGNGPSLRGVDLKSLSSYSTIGLNAAYRYWKEIDWRPTYYACLDLVVGLSHKKEISKLIEEGVIRKFLLRENLIDALGGVDMDRVVNFDALRMLAPVLQPADVTTGSHAALWAAFLGYEKIVLLGVDAQYTEMVPGARRRQGTQLEIVEEADNPNYFFKSYQQPGDRYNLPNPTRGLHVDAWREAALNLKNAGVKVYNANPDSAVRVFPYIDLKNFLNGAASPAPAKQTVSDMTDTQSPATGRARFIQFLKSHAGLLLGVLAAALLGVFVAAAAGGDAATLTYAFALFYPLFALALYARSAIIAHLRSLDARAARLEAAYKDLARRQDGAKKQRC
ncbi:hypothetical protein [Hyphococcus sp.]|uniref:hypothetical protein n=1 Tax=Hyphococcus sp. TaxID=2038636 RepID=UPI003CCB79B9